MDARRRQVEEETETRRKSSAARADFVQVTAPHLVRLYARENLPSNRL